MAVLKKFDFAGKEVGQENIDDSLMESRVSGQMIKDYLVALRANARQWSANTKTRSEVNHSSQKPHPQKGTGRARQGYLGAPQYKGGGRVHAPRPKYAQHVRINRKERRSAIRHLIIEKIREGRVHLLELPKLELPKTKLVANFLRASNLSNKRILFLGEAGHESGVAEKYRNFANSVNNIPRIEFNYFSNISGYDVALGHEIILMTPAFNQLVAFLEGRENNA